MFRGHPLAARPRGAAAVFYGVWPAHGGRRRVVSSEETVMNKHLAAGVAVVAMVAAVSAADIKVDLSKEQVGKPPVSFTPMVGTWVIAQDGADKVVMVDGRPVGGEQGQSHQAPDRERAQAVRHVQRGVDGQREAVRVLPGGRAQERPVVLQRHHQPEVQDGERGLGPVLGHPLQREAERRLAGGALQRHREQRRALGIPQRHPPPRRRRARGEVDARPQPRGTS